MPDSLADQVPDFHPFREGLVVAGLGALSVVPIAGGAAATVVAGALSAHSARRNLELMRGIAVVVDGLTAQIEGLTVEAITENPRFIAAAERLARAAQGTADDEHRARLIRALRHAGPWSAQEPYATERMTDLLIRTGPLHIFLTRYFADPGAWIMAHSAELWERNQQGISGSANILGILSVYVFPNGSVPPGEVARVVAELQRESVIQTTRDADFLTVQMSSGGVVEPRLTEFGKAFLAFAEGELDP